MKKNIKKAVKAIAYIAIFATAICLGASKAQAQDTKSGKGYTREGTTFVQQKGVRSSSSTDQVTAYKWRDSKGQEYPIVLHTYTKGEKAGKTTCYVVKKSAKTGKEYKYYLPDGEAIAEQIISENR